MYRLDRRLKLEAANAAATMAAMDPAPAHMAGPGMAAAVFVPAAVKVMMSVHNDKPPPLWGTTDISKPDRRRKRI